MIGASVGKRCGKNVASISVSVATGEGGGFGSF